MTGSPCVDIMSGARFDVPPAGTGGRLAFEVEIEVEQVLQGAFTAKRAVVSFGGESVSRPANLSSVYRGDDYVGPIAPRFSFGAEALPYVGMKLGLPLVRVPDRDAVWWTFPPFFSLESGEFEFSEVKGCGLAPPTGLPGQDVQALDAAVGTCDSLTPNELVEGVRANALDPRVRGQLDLATCTLEPAASDAECSIDRDCPAGQACTSGNCR